MQNIHILFKKTLKIKIDVIQLKLKIRNLMLLYNCYETKVKRTILTKRFVSFHCPLLRSLLNILNLILALYKNYSFEMLLSWTTH